MHDNFFPKLNIETEKLELIAFFITRKKRMTKNLIWMFIENVLCTKQKRVIVNG